MKYGATPTYNGNTPTKAQDDQYTYTFDEWSPAISTVVGNQTYTATYTSHIRSYDVSIVASPSAYGSVNHATANANY